jgi:prolyl-tRNA synthetase
LRSLSWFLGPRVAGKKKKEVKKETKLGMAYKKDDNFGEWYSEVRFLASLNFSYRIGEDYQMILRAWMWKQLVRRS